MRYIQMTNNIPKMQTKAASLMFHFLAFSTSRPNDVKIMTNWVVKPCCNTIPSEILHTTMKKTKKHLNYES